MCIMHMMPGPSSDDKFNTHWSQLDYVQDGAQDRRPADILVLEHLRGCMHSFMTGIANEAASI
jgi:hypothetical protein